MAAFQQSLSKSLHLPVVFGCLAVILIAISGLLLREYEPGKLVYLTNPLSGDRSSCHHENMQMALKELSTNMLKRESYVEDWSFKPIADLDTLPTTPFLDYWTPVYPCYHEVRVGDVGDSGKWICNPHRLTSKSVVYSVGSNGQASFEQDLFALTGAEIHVFDCTLDEEKTKAVEALSHVFKFHPLCLGPKSEGVSTVSIMDIMSRLDHKRIDVLKVDCEGCEYTSFKEIFGPEGGVTVGQFLVETHNWDALNNPDADHKVVDTYFRELELGGLRLFHVEPNWRWYPAAAEWAFVNATDF